MNSAAPIQASSQAMASPPWFFMNGSHATAQPQVLNSSPDEEKLSAQIHAKNSSSQTSYGNLRTLKPLDPSTSQQDNATTSSSTIQPASPAMTTPSHPVILALANNDDLNVSTIAREAQKATGKTIGNEEVVISLH